MSEYDQVRRIWSSLFTEIALAFEEWRASRRFLKRLENDLKRLKKQPGAREKR